MSTVPSGASPATASGPTLTELEQSVSRIRTAAAASWHESLIRLLMALAPSDNPFRCSALRTVPVRLKASPARRSPGCTATRQSAIYGRCNPATHPFAGLLDHRIIPNSNILLGRVVNWGQPGES